MIPRLSGHFCTFGLVFSLLNSLLGIARQWSREKFAILTLQPRSHVRILIYRTWAIKTMQYQYSIVPCRRQYLINELVCIEKRALSIIMPGLSYGDTCKFGGITPMVNHYRQLCSTFFNTSISVKNHNLFNLLPSRNNPRFSLRNNRAYNIPRVCINRAKYSFILAMARQMPPFN